MKITIKDGNAVRTVDMDFRSTAQGMRACPSALASRKMKYYGEIVKELEKEIKKYERH